ncbi:MAG: hypothetical protein ABIG61_14000 [Planctomycetota bacterium]
MSIKHKTKKVFFYLATLAGVGVLIYTGRNWYYGAATVHELLTENRHLKQAITNLTAEDQVGYAKVISQGYHDGKLSTTIKFVETDRENKLRKVLEKEYTIEGDVIHFDALIVKFGEKMVMDGKGKALYLWRRVYSDNVAPENGMPIDEAGMEPGRYSDLLAMLPAKQKDMFWANIWELANNPDKLKQYDIKAIYGNVVYSKLRPGLIYVFKISPAGQVHPEVVPVM